MNIPHPIEYPHDTPSWVCSDHGTYHGRPPTKRTVTNRTEDHHTPHPSDPSAGFRHFSEPDMVTGTIVIRPSSNRVMPPILCEIALVQQVNCWDSDSYIEP